MSNKLTKAEKIFYKFADEEMALHHDVVYVTSAIKAIEFALKGSGYSENDLRDAFYKGREQVCLPDEKATTLFLRPTFNGYLRELAGEEDPMANYQKRCKHLINDKDYDFNEWETMHKLREIQEKYEELNPPASPKIPNAASILNKWIPGLDPDVKMEVIGAMNEMACKAIDMNK